MVNIFFSYSHKDEGLRDELEKHLTILKRKKIIEAWHDRRIDAGSDFSSEISGNLKKADIILLLISSDFLNSDYCYDIEMQEAMRMQKEGTASVIPIILRPCDWHDTIFGKLLALPNDGKPVTTFANLDDAFLQITNGIKQKIKPSAKPLEATESTHNIVTSGLSQPRSSNLGIIKNFSDHEKDKFLRDSFAYIVNFFEGSLQELEKRNPDISNLSERIDSQTFSAVIYRDGKKQAECMIFTGSGITPKNINYSNQINSSRNMLNESLQVVSNGHMLLLKPSGMSAFRVIDNGEITQEGGAEFFWQMFIARLQRQ